MTVDYSKLRRKISKAEQEKRQAEFTALLTQESADAIVGYILDNFGKSDDKRLLDYDFRLKDGVMIPPQDSNTTFSIDFVECSIGKAIVCKLADEEMEVTEAMRDNFMTFLSMIGISLSRRQDELGKKLGVAMGNESMQFKSIRVDSVMLIDLPEVDWVLSVNKYGIKGYAHEPVTEELIKEHLKTGDDLDVILKRKKLTGELRFMLVESISKKKAIYECDVRMTVDYSVK